MLQTQTGKHFTDIKPDNLRFDQTTNKLKLDDIGLYNSETRSGYLKMLRNADSKSSLTPKQMSALQSNQAFVDE